MAACTKSNVQYEQTGELTLAPVTQKSTKAAVADAVYPTTEKFNVWAWWGKPNAGSKPADNATTEEKLTYYQTNFSTLYIDKGTFKAKNNFSWCGVTPYYWPTTGSLFFAGYSPASANGKFNYALPTQTLTIEDYIQSNVITETNDLMWFDATDKSYDQNEADVNGVPVVFQHALSWLTFKFKLKDNNTPNNWKITKVELKGIENKGSFSSSNKSWGIASDATSNVVEVFRKDSGYDELTNTAMTLEGSSAITSGGSVLVIPQSCAYTNKTTNDASLVITYNLKNPAGDPTYLSGQTITLPLNGGTGQSAWEKWDAGKHYIYTITFGANEILIAPTVATWVTVDQNIEVQ